MNNCFFFHPCYKVTKYPQKLVIEDDSGTSTERYKERYDPIVVWKALNFTNLHCNINY